MSQLTIAKKIGQLFFIGIPGPELDAATRDLLDEIQPGGVCLFARNIRERRQTRELLDNLRDVLWEPMLSVDQEGGLVDRLRRIMTPMPSADKILSAGDAALLGRNIASTLRTLGFNMNFAPVVDVIDSRRAGFANGLHSRAFGRSKEESVQLASIFLSSMQENGIIGCPKHFPGLGASEVDSHKELPAVSIDEEEFYDQDLFPYRKLLAENSVHSVMVAHAAYKNVRLQEADQHGKLLPSSLSPAIISKLLRSELGFGGVVLTDDLEMGAIVENYGIGDACKMAIAAGVDMLAICASPAAVIEGYRAVAAAVETDEISEERIDESIDRISVLRKSLPEALEFDETRLDALSNEIAELNARLK